MSLIYRIEHPTIKHSGWNGTLKQNAGAYSDTVQACRADDNEVNYQTGSNHPAPWDDGIEDCTGKLFGFLTLADARRWFYSERDLTRWNTRGMRLAIWPTSAASGVTYGGNQLAFVRPACAPMYLPAYAIHQFTEEAITDMAWDFFTSKERVA